MTAAPRPAYDREQRRALQAAARLGEPLVCPACAAALEPIPVEPPPGVPYVRHRVLVVCGGCGRSAALDVAGPSG